MYTWWDVDLIQVRHFVVDTADDLSIPEKPGITTQLRSKANTVHSSRDKMTTPLQSLVIGQARAQNQRSKSIMDSVEAGRLAIS